jgi:hypothetical protein
MTDDERQAYYASGVAHLKREHGPRLLDVLLLRRYPRCRCGQLEPCPVLVRGLAYFEALS